jgi:hypothetical protein
MKHVDHFDAISPDSVDNSIRWFNQFVNIWTA